VVYHLSDNDIGVTRADPTAAGKYRPGYEEALRLVDAGAVDVVFCWKWDRFIREPMDLEYLIPRFDKAGVRFAEADGIIDLGTARPVEYRAALKRQLQSELPQRPAATKSRRFTRGPVPKRWTSSKRRSAPCRECA
jgi:DNA invertase Pin-like site-specific DNA recombinase